MAEIRKVVEAVANARQAGKRKLRWPISRAVIAPASEEVVHAVGSLEGVLSEQANAKEIVLLGVGEEWAELGVEAIPDMAKLGPAFKKDSGIVAAAISGADASAMKGAIEETGSYDLDGVAITGEMEIEAEGYAAEVIRRIQDMRKELDLEVNDWIRVAVELSDERIAGFLQGMESFVAEEVRAKELSIGGVQATGDLVKDWTVESVEMRIGVGT
jgi:isoleucyl-tRNA synthetase